MKSKYFIFNDCYNHSSRVVEMEVSIGEGRDEITVDACFLVIHVKKCTMSSLGEHSSRCYMKWLLQSIWRRSTITILENWQSADLPKTPLILETILQNSLSTMVSHEQKKKKTQGLAWSTSTCEKWNLADYEIHNLFIRINKRDRSFKGQPYILMDSL